MITPYIINATTWTAISTVGQNGSCWIDEDANDQAGKADCRISHSESGDPSLATSKRVFTPIGNTDVLPFTADSATDIYYARCINEGDSVTLFVDVV